MGLSPTYAWPLADPGSFVVAVAGAAQAETRDFSVPASFNIAQASHESDWWNVSSLATTYHNYYGIKCNPPNEAGLA